MQAALPSIGDRFPGAMFYSSKLTDDQIRTVEAMVKRHHIKRDAQMDIEFDGGYFYITGSSGIMDADQTRMIGGFTIKGTAVGSTITWDDPPDDE